MLQTWLRWEPEPGFVRIFLARLCHFGELVLGAGNLESKFLRQIPLTYHIKHRFHFFFSVVSGIDPKNERKNHGKVGFSSFRPGSAPAQILNFWDFWDRLRLFGELVLGPEDLEYNSLRQITLTHHIKHSLNIF